MNDSQKGTPPETPRERKEKDDWKYQRSEKLGMEIAIKKTPTGPKIMTADKISYSPREVALLHKAGGIDPEIHMIKKIFGGKIIAVQDVHRPWKPESVLRREREQKSQKTAQDQQKPA